MNRCLKCGADISSGQSCGCAPAIDVNVGTPRLLQKNLNEGPGMTEMPVRRSPAPVPSFSELLQQSQKPKGPAGPILGMTPVDEEGNLLTPALRNAPRINLLGKVQVAVPWTEAITAPEVPAFDFSSHPAVENDAILPVAPKTREAAWAQSGPAQDIAPLAAPRLPLPAEPASTPVVKPASVPAGVLPVPLQKAPVSTATERKENPSSETEDGASVTFEVAPLWRLVSALLLDGAILAAVVFGVFSSALHVVGIEKPNFSVLWAPATAFALLFAWLYAALFGFLLQGRTPGRYLSGLRLIDGNGRPPSAMRAWVRASLAFFSWALFLGGFYLALVSRNRQTLHDKLSFTWPVRSP